MHLTLRYFIIGEFDTLVTVILTRWFPYFLLVWDLEELSCSLVVQECFELEWFIEIFLEQDNRLLQTLQDLRHSSLTIRVQLSLYELDCLLSPDCVVHIDGEEG